MALPNYSPEGIILLGCVPWDNSYTNVRLYSSTTEQASDMASMLTLSVDDYVYVSRSRRLKVNIHADRLYHINYCAYRNASLTAGWIYCFVTNVEYINDQTTELTIETDVFQTYLHGTDWILPPCFIERKTVSSESDKYLYTAEPDFTLVQKPWGIMPNTFTTGGYVVMTCEFPQSNSGLIEQFLNPNGWYGRPAPIQVFKGTVQGANFFYVQAGGSANDNLETFLNGLTFAGAIDSVVAIFTVPSFATGMFENLDEHGFVEPQAGQDSYSTYQATFTGPGRGNVIGAGTDSYTPKNKKLLYYPYTYMKLSDYNGNECEYRYEWFTDGNTLPMFEIKYAPNAVCQAIVYPRSYMGAHGFLSGAYIVTNCGSQGSWSNNMYQTWLAQNGGRLAVTAAGVALTGIAGGSSMAAASQGMRREAEVFGGALSNGGSMSSADIARAGSALDRYEMYEGQRAKASNVLKGAGLAAGSGATNVMYQSKQPTVSRGSTDYSLMFQTGVQGVYAMRMQVIPEIARQIDDYFSRYGYSVNDVETVNFHGRPVWDYVKTDGAAARSYNTLPSAGAPHSRGRGCPSDALAIINARLDSGCTFWHTTANFGDYSQDNSIEW